MRAPAALELDHVLIAVADLTRGAEELEDRYGLASIEGGRHPGWGTANRIVPLRATYLELIAVVDHAEAAATPFGRWVTSASTGGLRPLGWAVRTRDIEEVAQRLGLSIEPKSRITPDGTELRWRSAGLEAAAAEPSLPFFIEWDPNTRHPSAAHAAILEIARLVIAGDAARLSTWLGDHELPVDVRPGPPAVESIILSDGVREIVV